MNTTPAIYRLKVTVDGIYPAIWRRLAVPETTSLAELHDILQIALGWEGYHLHKFEGLFDRDFGLDGLVLGEALEDATLAEIVGREGARLGYVYDFGDYWEHTIVVEGIGRPAPRTVYPRCLAGARAAPPEDCGGPDSYMAMLARRCPRRGSARRTTRRRGFDPAAFDRDAVNQALAAWQRADQEGAGDEVPPPVPPPAPPTNRRYQLHIALLGIAPPIWRRLVVPGQLTLNRLHRLLQAAVGRWYEIDLHRFVVGGIEYGLPGQGRGWRSSRAIRLEQAVLEVGARFEYWFDDEPGWGHTVRVEAITEVARPTKPKCLAGARAVPPEGCAGVSDYAEILTAVQNPQRRRPQRVRELLEWIEEDFDPETCDVKALNRALERVH